MLHRRPRRHSFNSVVVVIIIPLSMAVQKSCTTEEVFVPKRAIQCLACPAPIQLYSISEQTEVHVVRSTLFLFAKVRGLVDRVGSVKETTS